MNFTTFPEVQLQIDKMLDVSINPRSSRDVLADENQ